LVGPEWFVALVDRFYDGVATNPVLRSLYPDDLEGPRHRLAGFLQQYWGGPAEYSAERGHPRLRMRHEPFRIGEAEREAWLRSMATALVGGGLTAPAETKVMEYFAGAASHLVNHPS
jgi:hemoglobin